MLASEVHGVGDDSVAFVHGFTQTRRSWLPVASRLASRHRMVLVDAPRHGGSADVGGDIATAASHVRATVGGRASYVGYSMGGRICLQLACDDPAAVDHLVLIGATAGIEDAAERNSRQRADAALADDLTRDGLDPFLDRWLASPLFATLPRDAAGLDDRRANRADALARSLLELGAGAMTPLWARLDRIEAEVLVLAGSRDEKFTQIGRQLADAIGSRARFVAIKDAGHAAHLEQPEAVAAVIADFLS